eukprot:CAMPEP_0202468138 /NCGR_PEP_ID=MMETSP1360-20130828/74334_1 /ASSEMBLY_ACC=CAM_ASM_000848 /TAXON_ID=515479 /ORGANISM="Licmophora paradoxa, Strain CCMP2313" /LENGTH=157 /DNA_ID=CAMNT_0049092955 /DNA_START=11 /DNA_END=484 /DNA_ORIENTATION=+
MTMDETKVQRIEAATSHAIRLIEDFANCDIHDVKSPWKNPDEIFAKLDEARKQVVDAFVAEEQDEAKKGLDENAFRTLYVDMVTDAFATVLDDMRSGNKDVDVNVLVDCLESGMDFLSSEEKDLFRLEFGDDELDESLTSIHEQRRSEVDFTVEIQS